jgi:hypothetical protein
MPWAMVLNRRHTFLLVVILMALAGGMVFFLWPKQTDQPLLRLKIVRRTEEQGKPVVFFRVEVADRRRMLIMSVERILGDISEGPLVRGSRNSPAHPREAWAPSQGWPIGDPKQGREEFGILVPTNAAVWRLRVRVGMETPNQFKRFKEMLRFYKGLRRNGVPILKAAKDAWNSFYGLSSQEVESGTITNSVPK